MSKDENPLIEGFLDGIISRVMKKVHAKDPKMKRLKKRAAKLDKELEAVMIDMFGSLDKVPPSYKARLNIK